MADLREKLQTGLADRERALELVATSIGPGAQKEAQYQLARIYLLVGELEKALDLVEPLVTSRYLLPDWVKIDPAFASLRGNPRFERLVNGR